MEEEETDTDADTDTDWLPSLEEGDLSDEDESTVNKEPYV